MEILNHPLFTLSIVLCILAEYGVSARLKLANYNRWEAYTSLVIVFLDRVIAHFTERDVSGPAQWLWAHRLVDLSCHRSLAVTFVAVELAYYWAHRYNHRTRLGWASHSIHHTPTRYNLTMGYRLGLTRVFTLAWMLFLPLMLLGFHPHDVALLSGVILLYQFFIHTELVPRLGPLEWVFNTPSNHRVHHGSDPRFFDKNFGGITLVFDHLFGTYLAEPAGARLDYGLAGIAARRSLAYEIFSGWLSIGARIRERPDPLALPWILFGPPDGGEPHSFVAGASAPVESGTIPAGAHMSAGGSGSGGLTAF